MDIYKTSVFKYVNGDMLVGHPITVTIRGVELQKVITPATGEAVEKPLVYFHKTTKPLILNKSNATALAAGLGRDTAAWVGAKVELYSEVGKLKGQPYNAVKVRVVEAPPQLSKAEHEERLKENTELLRGPADEPIGEDEPQIDPVDVYRTAEDPAPAQDEFKF